MTLPACLGHGARQGITRELLDEGTGRGYHQRGLLRNTRHRATQRAENEGRNHQQHHQVQEAPQEVEAAPQPRQD